MRKVKPEEVQRLMELLKECYTHIVFEYSTWGKAQLIEDLESFFKIEKPAVPTDVHNPGAAGLSPKNQSIINDMIYTPMTQGAVGMKHGISSGRVAQVFHKYVRSMYSPTRRRPYAWIIPADGYSELDEYDEKKFHRHIAVRVVDNAFDQNVSRALNLADALKLAHTLNREKREMSREEQIAPDRQREIEPLYEVVEIPPLPVKIGRINTEDWMPLGIEHLELSVRARHGLEIGGIRTVGELLELNEKILLRFDGLGKISVDEIKYELEIRGLQLNANADTTGERISKYLQSYHYMTAVLQALIDGPVRTVSS